MTKKKVDKRWNQILRTGRLIPLAPGKKLAEKRQKKVKARRTWGSEAFQPSGEISFSDDEH